MKNIITTIKSWNIENANKDKILAKYKGLECGKEYIEAFYLVRSINQNGI